MTPRNDDPALRQTMRTVLLVGVVFTLGSLGLAGGHMGVSVAVGAAMAYANLALLARSVSRLLGGAGGSWAAVFVLKFSALLALTYFLIDRELVNPLGLALGFGALPLGVTLGGLLTSELTSERSTHDFVASASPAVAVAPLPGHADEAAARKD